MPVSLFELTFGVLGDLFGRKRLLIGGALLLAVGEAVVFLSPGAGASTGTRVAVVLIGQALAGIGAGALFPTSLAMIASATHTAQNPGPRHRGMGLRLHLRRPHRAGDRRRGRPGALRLGRQRGLALGVPRRPGARRRSAPGSPSSPRTPRPRKGARSTGPARSRSPSPFSRCCSRSSRGPPAAGAAGRSSAASSPPPSSWWRSSWPSSGPRRRCCSSSFFRHRSFAAVSVVTVIGMFAFLGTVYAIAIRLATVQGFSPLKTSHRLGPGRRDDADPAARRPPPAGALRHQVGARRRARHHGGRRPVAGRDR